MYICLYFKIIKIKKTITPANYIEELNKLFTSHKKTVKHNINRIAKVIDQQFDDDVQVWFRLIEY